MACPTCPVPGSNSEWELRDVQLWHNAGSTVCNSCKLLYNIAVKFCGDNASDISYDTNLDVLFLRIDDRTWERTILYTDDEHVADEFPYIRMVDYHVDSAFFAKSGVECASKWLDYCLEKHSTCGSNNTNAPLPTRLVAVGSSTCHPYLYIPKPGEKGSYTTLSYCWGNGEPFKTTNSTLEKRKEGFPLENLPKTCQDAVLVTRGLGISYIWIDQLCIMQDLNDPEDWNKESATMNSTYANSLLTLAALSSPGGDTGLYTYNRSNKLKKASVAAEVTLSNGGKSMVHAKRSWTSDRFDFIHSPDTPCPPAYLESRLWTLQEIALSRRVLWFGHGDLGWSCKQSTACECDPYPVPATQHQLPPHLASDLAPVSQPRTSYWLPIWYGYIEEATQRLVTVQSDRLPAVAGLAAALQSHIGGRYIAGHWTTDIEKSLLWEMLDEEKWRYRGTAALPPMDQDYAPSWSWASVSRPMTHATAMVPEKIEGNMDCKVLDIDFRPSTTNLYGPGRGVLTMEAVVISVEAPKGIWGSFQQRSGAKRVRLHASQRNWRPDPRGDHRAIQERDLYIAIHLHWPEDVAPDEWGIFCGLVLERVQRDEFGKWNTRFQECMPRSFDRAEAGVGEAVGTDLAHNTKVENVFRRVGCVTSLFKLVEVTWEELVEEYKVQFQII